MENQKAVFFEKGREDLLRTSSCIDQVLNRVKLNWGWQWWSNSLSVLALYGLWLSFSPSCYIVVSLVYIRIMFVGYAFFVLFIMPQKHFYPAVKDALLIYNWQFLIYIYTPGASPVIPGLSSQGHLLESDSWQWFSNRIYCLCPNDGISTHYRRK